MEARATELLPVPYFHIVFTLPNQLGPLALQNKKTVYGILFRAAWETVRELAKDPKHLGAKVAMLSVLHTWGSNLMHHPHLHCIVPGGGISADGQQWISVKNTRKRKAFFLPVRVMSRVFRGKFIQHLKAVFRKGKLAFHGSLSSLNDSEQFKKLLDSSVKQDWVVYCKRPFGGPRQVLKYLARYTHRVAIANSRLVDYEDGKISFRWKDYRNGSHTKTMQLDGVEFMRRFLIHILPIGFVRIRHHGFLANRNRGDNLEKCRKLLGVTESSIPTIEVSVASGEEASSNANESGEASNICPSCQSGRMQHSEVRPLRRVSTRRVLILFATGLGFQDSS